MEFETVSDLFRNTVKITLNSGHISERHVKKVSVILKKFANLNRDDIEIERFYNDVSSFFVCLNAYVKQFVEVTPLHHFTIRMALGILLFVVDTLDIYVRVATKFVDVIDSSLEDPENFNIKEYLRVYSHILDYVTEATLIKLVITHESFESLYKLLKSSNDIELQAIIIEVIFKLFRCNIPSEYEEPFLEILQFSNTVSITENYPNIRMALDHLNNAYTTDIFSICCSSIELNSRRVEEFKGSNNASDSWLDVDLYLKRISFFADKTFLKTITQIKFYNSTAWEVMSFSVKNVVNTKFEYNELTENLNIILALKSSSFTLFVGDEFDKLQKVEICVSRYADKFFDLVQKILPNLFPEFNVRTLNIPVSQEESSLSETPDNLVSKNNDDSNHSSPVIERFEVHKKISARSLSPVSISDSESSDSVIAITDDEDDDIVETSKSKPVAVFNGGSERLVSTFRTNVGTMLPSRAPEETVQENYPESKSKVSVLADNANHLFNKSISPISFSGSLFGKGYRISPQSDGVEVNNNYKKISEFKNLPNKNKISTLIDRAPPKTKISSSLLSPVIDLRQVSKKPKNKAAENANRHKIQKELVEVEISDDESLPEVSREENHEKVTEEVKRKELRVLLERIPQETKETDLEVLPEIAIETNKTSQVLPERTIQEIVVSKEVVEVTGMVEDVQVVPEIVEANAQAQVLQGATEANVRDENLAKEVMEEPGMLEDEEVLQSCQFDDSLDRSRHKVEDWLKKVDPSAIPTVDPSEKNSDVIRCAPSVVSERSLNMRPEERMKLLMPGSESIATESGMSKDLFLSDKPLFPPKRAPSNASTLDLVKILSSQIEDLVPEEGPAFSFLKKDAVKLPLPYDSDSESDQPLAAVAEKIKPKDDPPESAKNSSKNSSTQSERKTKTSKKKPKLQDTTNVFNGSSKNVSTKLEAKAKNHETKSKKISEKANKSKSKEESVKRNDITILSKSANANTRKRKLYNPGDLSYLNFSDEYLNTKDSEDLLPVKQKTTKPKKTTKEKTKRTRRNKKTDLKTSSRLTKSDLLAKNKSVTVTTSQSNNALTKVFESFKDKIRQYKQEKKDEKRSKLMRGQVVSSSSSSMEPFGEAVESLKRKRTGSGSSAKGVTEKKLKEDLISEKKNPEEERRIHILSNVVIQPANNDSAPKPPDNPYGYEGLAAISHKYYLDVIQYLAQVSPDLLRTNDCNAIRNFLQQYK